MVDSRNIHTKRLLRTVSGTGLCGSPNPGWAGNIMADGQTGKAEQRNIDAIVKDGVSRFNTVQKQLNDLNKNGKGKLSNDTVEYQSTGVFKYEIDITKPNK